MNINKELLKSFGLQSIITLGLSQIGSYLYSLLDQGGVDHLNQTLSGLISDSYIFAIILFIGLCIVSPILEELVFRKWLWYIGEKWFKILAYNMIFVTAILFSVAHGTLSHIIGIAPLALYWGWLRYKYGSIKRTIVLHIINNIVAAAPIFIS